MAEEKDLKLTPNQDIASPYLEAVQALILAKKSEGQVHYDELTEKIASPYGLDADGIDTLIQIVEDNGVSVVGDDGGPTKQQMVREEEQLQADLAAESKTATSKLKVSALIWNIIYLLRGNLRTSIYLNVSGWRSINNRLFPLSFWLIGRRIIKP